MGPCSAIAVSTGLHILVALLGCALNLFAIAAIGDPFAAPRDGTPPIVHIGHAGIVICVQTFILGGAIYTLRGGNYGIAMTIAILSVVPCFCSSCVILGIPFAIWLIVLLNDKDMHAALR